MKKDHYRGPGALKSQYPLRSLEQKIDMYERRLNGWYIEIAKSLKNSPIDGGPGADPVSLMAAISQFEALGVYLQGSSAPLKPNGEPKSKANFEYAFLDFLSKKHLEWSPGDCSRIAAIIYKQVRCGLFHIGSAKKGIEYFRGPDDEHPTPSISLRRYKGKVVALILNVPSLVLEIDDYFKEYLRDLRDKKSNRRKSFAEGWNIIKRNIEMTP